ncbi:MAG: TrmH family RNA methyltransferase [Nitrospirota bacterium]
MTITSPHSPLSSKDNKAVRFLCSLADPKARKKEKAFLIEGVKMVEEALRDKLGVKQVIAAPSLTQHHGRGVIKLAERIGIEILWVSERMMDAVAESKTPQPVMAVVEMHENPEDALISHSSRLIVIAHQLQDPGNLGTIIRTAEAVGAAGVAVTQNSVDPYNPKTVRASMGSILRLPVVKVGDMPGFLGKCRKAGFQTAAMVLQGDRSIFDADLTKPTVFLFGQEGSGLQGDLLESVALKLTIPMAETIDSLNVATSAAVVLYEALRQRIKR